MIGSAEGFFMDRRKAHGARFVLAFHGPVVVVVDYTGKYTVNKYSLFQ